MHHGRGEGAASASHRRRLGEAAPALMRVWFLDANDAAVSKYARGEPRDQRWIRSGVLNGLISLPVVTARLRTTTFLDADEERRARSGVEADRIWFEQIKRGRRK
jgi:hypothetical protein